MPTAKRRVSLIPDPELLAVCGRDLSEGGKRGVDASQQILGVLRRHSLLIDHAGRELDGVLTRAEWNLIADVNNGCADLWGYSNSPVPPLAGITANVEDGDRLDGAGAKWDVAVPSLLDKLRALTPLHGEAIADAIRWFWDHCDSIDHAKDHWWLPSFRRRAVVEG